MLRSGLRKIWRDILSRKMRTILVSASIFVGVLGVIALFTTSAVISRQLEEDVQEAKLAMLDLTVSIPTGTTPDNETLLATLNRQNAEGQALPALEGIEIVEGRAYYDLDFKKPGAERFQRAEIRSYYKAWDAIVLEPLRLLEGSYPAVGQNQVALEVRMAELNGFQVGDEIIFRTTGVAGSQEIPYTVSGLVFHPYSATNLAGDAPGPDIGIYANFEDVQTLLGVVGINRFVARYQSFEQAQFDGFVSTVGAISPYIPLVPSIENPADNMQVQNAQVFINILNALALTTMIVSAFLVVNVINTIIAEQKQQIGILKALGVSDGEAFAIYSGIALAYGILGTLAAIIPGILVGQAITGFLSPRLDIRVVGFHWSLGAVLLGILLGLLVPVLAVAYPVYRAARLSIREAITDLGISGTYGQGLIPSLIAALPLPISLRQAVSNVYQKRWRLLLTGTTLTVTIGTFMGSAALTVSVSNEIRAVYGRLGYEVRFEPHDLHDYRTTQAALESIEGVKYASPASLVFIQMPGDYINFFTSDNQVQVFGLDPTSDVLRFEYTDGEGWINDPNREGIVLARAAASQLGLQNGDTLPFLVGGQPVEKEVIGVEANAFDFVYMRWQEISALAHLVAGAPRPNEYLVPLTVGENTSALGVGMDEAILALLGNPSGVVISGDLASATGLNAGDSLPLQVNGQALERPIGLVIPNAELAAQAARLSPQFATMPPYVVLFGFADLTSLTGVELAGEPVPNAFYVALTTPEVTREDADAMIEVIQRKMLAAGITGTYTNELKQVDAFVETTQSNTSIFLIVSVLIAAVGAIGLLTTLTISVFERQKEIGVMRSIGAGASSIAAQFILEGVLVGFGAWLVGVPLGYVVAIVFNKIANLDDIPFTYPPVVLVAGLVGMLTVCSLASLGPSLAAARKTVSEILRYQ